jgi:hypothetical protein
MPLVWKNDAERRRTARPVLVIQVLAALRVVGASFMALASPIAGMCESGRCLGEGRWSGALAVGGAVGTLEAIATCVQARRLRRTILDSADLPPNLIGRRSTFMFAAAVDVAAMVTVLCLLSLEPNWVPVNLYQGALAIAVAITVRLNRAGRWADDAASGVSNREHPLQVSGDIVNTSPSGTKPR